jgi:hypothetical protein
MGMFSLASLIGGKSPTLDRNPIIEKEGKNGKSGRTGRYHREGVWQIRNPKKET